MKPRYFFVLVILVLVALFALLNWSIFLQPASLNFLVGRVDAPLGVILLLAMGALALAYLIGAARLEIRSGMETRDLYRELERARQLAERAEASRLSELKDFLHRETTEIQAKLDRLLERGATDSPPLGTSR